MKREFKIGDRVTVNYSTEGAVWPRTHGVIVYYKGRHYKKEPRVRWEDGWGTSVRAEDLRPLTEDELRKWPTLPILYPVDQKL